jgi:hypothetical protein
MQLLDRVRRQVAPHPPAELPQRLVDVHGHALRVGRRRRSRRRAYAVVRRAQM